MPRALPLLALSTVLVAAGLSCGPRIKEAEPAPIGVNGCGSPPGPYPEVDTRGPEQVEVPPGWLEGRRIAGDAHILLSDRVRKAMRDRHMSALQLRMKLCLTDAGVPYCIDFIRPSGDEEMDDTIVQKVRRWRYSPYTVDGKPVSVCTEIIWNYRLAR